MLVNSEKIGFSGALRAHVTTFAPASRKDSEITRPRPRVPPVTITVLPSKSRILALSIEIFTLEEYLRSLHSVGCSSVEVVIDKKMTETEVIEELSDGMTIGIGGWGSRRKPMSLVRAIARSDLKDLTIVSYGGPDIGLLCATGKIRKAIYGFVSLDSIPLEPHFRNAKQEGTIETSELDEGAFYLGLLAAAHRMPFYPTRAGMGSDMLMMNPDIKTIESPYKSSDGEKGEELVAIPALNLDVSLIHMNRADSQGNGQFLGPDLYFDDLFAKAAKRTFMSCEKIIPTEDFLKEGSVHTLKIPRLFVNGVIEAPRGAHFTECPPDYDRDEVFQSEYAASAKDLQSWENFKQKYLEATSHQEYLKAVDSRTQIEESQNG